MDMSELECSIPCPLLAQIEKILPPLLILEENGDIYWATEGVQKLLGYEQPDLIDQNISILVALDEKQTILNALRANNRQLDSPLILEAQLQRRDGVWANVELQRVSTLDWGAEDRLAFTLHNITPQKKVERELRQRNLELALLNRAGQIFEATLELDKIFALVLEEVRRLMGVVACSIWLIESETEEVVCCQAVGPKTELVRGWRLPMGSGLVGTVASSGESLNVADVLHDGRHFEAVDEETGLPLRSILSVPLLAQSKVIGVLQALDVEVGRFTDSDVTLLEALSNSAAVAINNARLVADLRQRSEELEKSNRELKSFAHTVAHDLKAPLTHIIGYAEVLGYQAEETLTSEQRDYLQAIHRGGRKMDSIIDELLLLAELREHEIQFAPVNMLECIDPALERLQPLLEQHQAQVELPEEFPLVRGYTPWLEEVWVNYLSNAVKYGGDPPKIEIGVESHSENAVSFWVRDNGDGFPEERRKHLFIPFSRLSEVDTQGYGLGLSIVQRIVTKLEGEVWARSDDEQGSFFGFTLPVAE